MNNAKFSQNKIVNNSFSLFNAPGIKACDFAFLHMNFHFNGITANFTVLDIFLI